MYKHILIVLFVGALVYNANAGNYDNSIHVNGYSLERITLWAQLLICDHSLDIHVSKAEETSTLKQNIFVSDCFHFQGTEKNVNCKSLILPWPQ
jgi:hypothetical protein